MTCLKWIFITCLLLVVVQTDILGQARAQVTTISVSQDSVTLNFDLVLRENLTALPVVNSHVSSANSTTIADPFLNAFTGSIQKKVVGAQLSSFDLTVKTSNASRTWTIEELYSMTIKGTNTNSGNNVRSNLGFVSMNLSQPLTIGSSELDGIGPTYLLPALNAEAANYTNLQYFIDGSQTRNAVIPGQTTKQFWLLDFTWVTPVSTWAKTTNTLDKSSQWTLKPSNPRYNLTLGVPSPEGILLFSYVSIYSPSLSLTAPAYAWVDGNILSFDVPSPAEILMPALVLVALIIVAVTFVLDRRLTGPLRLRKKR